MPVPPVLPCGICVREGESESGLTSAAALVRVGYWSNSLVRTDLHEQTQSGNRPAKAHAETHFEQASPALGGPLPLPVPVTETRRMAREQENRQCIGGMRHPWRTLQRCPQMQEAGRKLRRILMSAIAAEPKWLRLIDRLGDKTFAARGSQTERELHLAVSRLRAQILEGLGYQSERTTFAHTLWRADVAEAWANLASDPDRVFLDWLTSGCPAGVAHPVISGGVFPPVDNAMDADTLDNYLTQAEPGTNYQSVEEAPETAGRELDRAIACGYAHRVASWREVQKEYGQVLVSRLACITKPRADGTEKVRLIIDMRRSGYNSCVRMSERLVLPRIKDLVEDTLTLEAELDTSRGEIISFMIADYEDAFHSLGVAEAEWPYLCVRHPLGGFVIYHTVVFGGAGCPLVWGRAGAFIGRSTQSILAKSRVELYVDDPCITLAGTGVENRCTGAVALMWWLALGLRISWNKGAFLQCVTWIGAQISAPRPDRVTVSLPEKYAKDVVDLLNAVRDVDASAGFLRQLAGKLSFAASVVPVLWAHVSCIWAALRDSEAAAGARSAGRKGQAKWSAKTTPVCNRRYRHAVEWLLLLFGAGPALSRTFYVRSHWCAPRFCAILDAPPWGGGAILASCGAVLEWLAVAWDHQDESAVQAKIGDCGSQSLWESYIMLIAVRQWLRLWQRERGCVSIRSDAKAALGAGAKLRSTRSPGMNRIMAEIALMQAETCYVFEIQYEHIAGQLNTAADALSRLCEPGAGYSVPPELVNHKRVDVLCRGVDSWRTPHSYAYATAELMDYE